jgi:hypothetical protein
MNNAPQNQGGSGNFRAPYPSIFDGDKKKFYEWMNEVDLFLMNNYDNHYLMSGGNRALTILGYMRGEGIATWVGQQIRLLQELRNFGLDEGMEVWNDFLERVRERFTDTTKQANAMIKMQKIAMSDDNLDGYIADFEQIIEEAGWVPDEKGTMLMFRKGLSKYLHGKVLDAPEPHPSTLAGWETLAQDIHRSYMARKAEMDLMGKGYEKKPFIDKRLFYNMMLQSRDKQNQKPQRSQRHPDMMDVDAAEVDQAATKKSRQWSNKDFERIRREKRCFNCGEKGHRKPECKNKARNVIRATEVEVKKEDLEEDFKKMLKSLNKEEKADLMTEVFGEEDF